jgi:uncharacterized protein
VRVMNQTKGKLLADRAWEAARLSERLRGLLGRAGLEPGEGIWIRPCTSIHSLFMRFRFDALFIDRAGLALHLIHAMRPWRLSRIVPRAAGVIELPAGVLAASGTGRGDRIVFEADPREAP